MKTKHTVWFALAGGRRHIAVIYEGTSAGHAKEMFHAVVPLLRASETKGRLSWKSVRGTSSTVTAYVDFDNGSIVDQANAGYAIDDQVPTECDADVFVDGVPVAILAGLDAEQTEAVIAIARTMMEDRVKLDWSFCAGRTIMKVLGDARDVARAERIVPSLYKAVLDVKLLETGVTL